MKQTKVVVLISTYNGEKYLKEQLDSIFKQKNIEPVVLIRDDGSTDSTKDIIKNYCGTHKLEYVFGENIGPIESFNELIKLASKYYNIEYYAFCDQDDVWLENKLSVAVQKLQKFDVSKPELYYCRTTLVDKDLNIMQLGLFPEEDYTLDQLLVRPVASGCTMVFNRESLNLYNLYKPGNILMHDYWMHLIVKAVSNQVYQDNQSYIYYRQHGNNTVGLTIEKKYRRLVKAFLKKPKISIYNYCEQLIEGYSEFITEDVLNDLNNILNAKNSFKQKITLLKEKKLYINVDVDKYCKKEYAEFFKVNNICVFIRLLMNNI